MPATAEVEHPIFSLSSHKLLALTSKWASASLSPIESYLLYLALLDSTELIEWRCAAQFHKTTPSIVANNMESLVSIIGKIDLIRHPAFTLPRFAISQDTSTLENSRHWIEAWQECYKSWIDGYIHSSHETRRLLEVRELSLQKLLKTAYASPEAVASNLSEWAALAGNFPTFSIAHPLSGRPVACDEYWKSIIRACANEDRLWMLPKSDLLELIEHCEENVMHGTIYAHHLMRLLRDGVRKYDEYLGFGEYQSANAAASFTVLPTIPSHSIEAAISSSVEDANLQALVNSAPSSEPKRSAYPSLFLYLKAKTRWDLAQKAQSEAVHSQ